MVSYKQYRENHGPVTAFVLSVHPVLWCGGWALAGLVGGLLLIAGGK